MTTTNESKAIELLRQWADPINWEDGSAEVEGRLIEGKLELVDETRVFLAALEPCLHMDNHEATLGGDDWCADCGAVAGGLYDDGQVSWWREPVRILLAAHDAAPSTDAVSAKAALADDIRGRLRELGDGTVGYEYGDEWLARFDAIEATS